MNGLATCKKTIQKLFSDHQYTEAEAFLRGCLALDPVGNGHLYHFANCAMFRREYELAPAPIKTGQHAATRACIRYCSQERKVE